MNQSTPVIEVKNLSRRFNEKSVLNGISFSADAGEWILLRGKNGAGKTTLLRILATLLEPSSGDALVHGISVAKNPKKAARTIGWVSSNQGGFFPRLTG